MAIVTTPSDMDALERIDRRLPEVMDALGPSDILVITADHRCDPTTPSTDHSGNMCRSLYGKSIKKGCLSGQERH